MVTIHDYNYLCNQAMEELIRDFKRQLPEELNKLPEKIQQVSITAYRPYFNDGSPCEYSLHLDADYCHINNDSQYLCDMEFGDKEYQEYADAVDIFFSFLADYLDDKIAEELFGEDAQITFDKNSGSYTVSQCGDHE
jgi:hypothetical protein